MFRNRIRPARTALSLFALLWAGPQIARGASSPPPQIAQVPGELIPFLDSTEKDMVKGGHVMTCFSAVVAKAEGRIYIYYVLGSASDPCQPAIHCGPAMTYVFAEGGQYIKKFPSK